MTEKNQALAAAFGGILTAVFDGAEEKQAGEQAYRACVMQMLMRIAVALEAIAAGLSTSRADVHTAASEDAAALAGAGLPSVDVLAASALSGAGEAAAGEGVTEAPKVAAAPGTENPAHVVTARLTETPDAEPAAKPEPAPAPAAKTAEQTAEQPAVVTARVEEQKVKAKELEPRLRAQMAISEAYKNASAEKRETPLGSYIRNSCAHHGCKSFGTVPEEKLSALVEEVLHELED